MYAVGGQVLYVGRAVLSPSPGHVSELDTSDPLFSLLDPAGRVRPVYIGVDLPAQDTRDMLATEMVRGHGPGYDFSKGNQVAGYLLHFRHDQQGTDLDGGNKIQLVSDEPPRQARARFHT